MLTSKHPGADKINKIYVETNHSQDGRSLSGFWVVYDPKDYYALFLLKLVLNSSDGVKFYWVFDEKGVITDPPPTFSRVAMPYQTTLKQGARNESTYWNLSRKQ